MDYQSFGSVVILLTVASMVVALLNNAWRHGNIDLTGRYANMRTIYGRAALIGVIVSALARINVIAMLREQPVAFSSRLTFYGVDLVDDAIGVLLTGVGLAFMSKFWNDFFDLVYELKRYTRGRANALRPDEQPRSMREPRDLRDIRRGRGRGSRGGRGMGGPGMGERGDRDRDRERGDRDRGDRDRGDRDRGDRDRGDREIRRPEPPPREPFGGNP